MMIIGLIVAFLYVILSKLKSPIFQIESAEISRIIIKPLNKSVKYKVFYSGVGLRDPINPKCLVQFEYVNESKDADILIFTTLGNTNYQEDNFSEKMGIRNDQILVFQAMECNSYYGYHQYLHKFNYTMDYRLTSDIPIPYSETFSFNESLPLENKTGFIAAFISNCDDNNNRMKYVEEMGKYVKIDSYGFCQHNTEIPEHYRSPMLHVEKMNVLRDYKFTIAFENSDDEDYVTEKLYHPLSVGSVPIYRGCKNVIDMAPPNSVIDANKFESAEALSKYLIYLDKNKTAYNKYLEWRVKGDFGNLKKVRLFRNSAEYGICALVERLENLWINPYLTDWTRDTNYSKLACQTCLKNFNVKRRRIPIETNDSFVLPEYQEIQNEIVYSWNYNEAVKDTSHSFNETLDNQYLNVFPNIILNINFDETFWWLVPYI
ncbi:hypothetical protein TRFO_01480 [Tritrichomonas foetus]|uniref:Fucosyltransferase n=1 Tax=Tritrichomonas foetus TaxID=1144522 RepID=A0A1J4JZ85_9EUKA|nr:hypothetical protein TRFO_01480 [Tritrichomonas foetus]|eukprot:OHT03800.1 hypothetical protein TRFO_01480 [Tritrichomonas foetus]